MNSLKEGSRPMRSKSKTYYALEVNTHAEDVIYWLDRIDRKHDSVQEAIWVISEYANSLHGACYEYLDHFATDEHRQEAWENLIDTSRTSYNILIDAVLTLKRFWGGPEDDGRWNPAKLIKAVTNLAKAIKNYRSEINESRKFPKSRISRKRNSRLFEFSEAETSIKIILGDMNSNIDQAVRFLNNEADLSYDFEDMVESLLSARDIANDIITGRGNIFDVRDIIEEISYVYKISKDQDFKVQISTMGRTGKIIKDAVERVFEIAKRLAFLNREI